MKTNEIQEVRKVNLKEKNIYRFTTTNSYNYDDDFIAIVCSLKEDLTTGNTYVVVVTENGKVDNFYLKSVKSATSIKGYPKEARDLLKRGYINWERSIKLEEQMDLLRREMEDIQDTYTHIRKEIRHAKGILTREEFLNEINKNLANTPLMDEMIKKGFKLEKMYCDTDFHISLEKDIQKWFGESAFTYREYDGTLHFSHQSKEYEKTLRKYSVKLSHIKCNQFDECLTLGDKDWLGYACHYIISLKKPLTKEYAKEVANKIQKK